MNDTTRPRTAGQPQGNVTYEQLAKLADLNWRWRRTLGAVCSHVGRGYAVASDRNRGIWPFSYGVTCSHLAALADLGYLTYTTSKGGGRDYRPNAERFAEIESTARMLGRL